MDTQASQTFPSRSTRIHRSLRGSLRHWRAARLIALLQQPCVTFAEIADQFGVTRECVRQWHQRLLPDAPTGHERQRLCRQYQRKRELFKDELFAGFYRRLRAQVPSERIGLIPARDGFRRRTVRLDDHVIALKRARASAAPTPRRLVSAGERRRQGGLRLLRAQRHRLSVPAAPVLGRRSATFVDVEGATYRQFKNTFGALWRSGRWSPE